MILCSLIAVSISANEDQQKNRLKRQKSFRCIESIESIIEAEIANKKTKTKSWRLLGDNEVDFSACIHLKKEEVKETIDQAQKDPSVLKRIKGRFGKAGNAVWKWFTSKDKNNNPKIVEYVVEMDQKVQEECENIEDPIKKSKCEEKTVKTFTSNDTKRIINEWGISFF